MGTPPTEGCEAAVHDAHQSRLADAVLGVGLRHNREKK